jgi:N-hydroxyarylamine O-acetyltransferase
MERTARETVQVDSYLDRLHYGGPTAVTLETLVRLHRAHMFAVPFENLDIHLGVPIALSVPALFEKIVTRRRGGYCYELNGLFAWLLAELGFKVTLHSGRVFSAGCLSAEFDHLVLNVMLPERWVADVGFGESSLVPLAVPSECVEADGYFVVEDEGVWTMRRMVEGEHEPQYVFSMIPRSLREFEDRNRFQQTSPGSHFTKNAVCSIPTPSGRITVAGRRLIVTTGVRYVERELEDGGQLRAVLEEDFGIALTAAEVGRLASSWH